MQFLMLWITMGLGVLVMCGVHETIASLGADAPESSTSVYVAMCMTLLVMVWPLVLLEMVRPSQR